MSEAHYVRARTMMLRKLLACLALFTGLAAAGTPAHAIDVVGASARIEASLTSASVSAVHAGQTAVRSVGSTSVDRGPHLPEGFASFSIVPSVYVGIDYARE